jgi:FkbM family methyltransferase
MKINQVSELLIYKIKNIIKYLHLNKLIKNFVNYFGLRVVFKKYNLNSSERLVNSLQYHNIDTILDIGANKGQFALDLLNADYKGNIISFEPLSNAYDQLSRNSRRYNKWTIHPKTAIGNFEGNIDINVSKNSLSSSILEITEQHLEARNDSFNVGKEKVIITKLDSIFKLYYKKNKRFFLKMDCQGYEQKILDGAQQSLENILGIHMEISLENLYVGQPYWKEIINRVESLGFEIWNIERGFENKKKTKMLQCDCTFYKKTS